MESQLTLLNFAHPITATQRAQIITLTGQVNLRIWELSLSLDHHAPFAAQIADLLDGLGLSRAAWQSAPLLVNPPGFSPAAAVLIAELHGRLGHFPSILRIRPVASSNPPQYEVAEILNLQATRDSARARRINTPS